MFPGPSGAPGGASGTYTRRFRSPRAEVRCGDGSLCRLQSKPKEHVHSLRVLAVIRLDRRRNRVSRQVRANPGLDAFERADVARVAESITLDPENAAGRVFQLVLQGVVVCKELVLIHHLD